MDDDLGLNAVLSLDVSPFEFGAAMAINAAKELISDLTNILTSGVGDSIDRVANQFKQSGNFDVTVKQMQEMQFAASQTSTNLTTLESAFRQLEKTAGKATFGDKKAQLTFDRVGIDPKAFAKMDLRQQMDAIANVFSKITNTSQRAAEATALFGRTGIEVSQFLKELDKNSDTFDTIATGVNEFNGALSEGTKQALGDVSSMLEDIWNNFASKLNPAITNTIKKFEEWGLTSKNLNKIMDYLWNGFVTGATYAIAAGITFYEIQMNGLKQLWGAFSGFFSAIYKGFSFVWNGALDFATGAINGMLSVMNKLENVIGPIMVRIANFIGENFTRMLNGVRTGLNVLIDGFNQISPAKIGHIGAFSFQKIADFQERSPLQVTKDQVNPITNLMNVIGQLDGMVGFSKNLKDQFGSALTAASGFMNGLIHGKAYEDADKLVGERSDARRNSKFLSLPEDPEKEKKVKSTPLGYAINGNNQRASLTALRLAQTQVQSVGDEGTHGLLKQLIGIAQNGAGGPKSY